MLLDGEEPAARQRGVKEERHPHLLDVQSLAVDEGYLVLRQVDLLGLLAEGLQEAGKQAGLACGFEQTRGRAGIAGAFPGLFQQPRGGEEEARDALLEPIADPLRIAVLYGVHEGHGAHGVPGSGKAKAGGEGPEALPCAHGVGCEGIAESDQIFPVPAEADRFLRIGRPAEGLGLPGSGKAFQALARPASRGRALPLRGAHKLMDGVLLQRAEDCRLAAGCWFGMIRSLLGAGHDEVCRLARGLRQRSGLSCSVPWSLHGDVSLNLPGLAPAARSSLPRGCGPAACRSRHR